MKRITFKSRPENFKKEYSGLKRNTVRENTEIEDIRFELLDDFINEYLTRLEIEIKNTKTSETFVRAVTDVTKFKGLYIISW